VISVSRTDEEQWLAKLEQQLNTAQQHQQQLTAMQQQQQTAP